MPISREELVRLAALVSSIIPEDQCESLITKLHNVLLNPPAVADKFVQVPGVIPLRGDSVSE